MNNKERISDGQKMYFEKSIASDFVDRERDYKNNQEHIGTSKIFESMILFLIRKENILNPQIANLGAGSTPDEFSKLIKNTDTLNRVEASPYMLNLGKKNAQNLDKSSQEKINFIEKDFFEYLQNIPDDSLDIIFMQYNFNLVDDLSLFFEIINKKLKKGGYFISDVNLYLKGIKPQSTNAFFGLNGQRIDEITHPKDGDIINVHFKKAVDSNEILCSMNIVFHSKQSILDILGTKELDYVFYDNREENSDYLKEFFSDEFNAGLNFSKAKSFIIIKK